MAIEKDTVKYNDPTPFPNASLQPIGEISKALRHKEHGIDVREAIAQQGEALVKIIQQTGGNQFAEVAAARGQFDLLGMREDAQESAINKLDVTTNSKFGKQDALAYLKGVTAVPETFSDLAAIKAKYPNGANTVMVAANDGHKYLWNGSGWIDSGVYQSVGLDDNAVTTPKIKDAAVSKAKLADNSVTPQKMTDASIIGSIDVTETIMLSADNTQLIPLKTYNSKGKLVDSNFSTVVFEVGKYDSIVLNGYIIGEFGGAFLDNNSGWISSFSTTDNTAKNVPAGATYIAISAKTDTPYAQIKATYQQTKYTLDNLMIKSLPDLGSDSLPVAALDDYEQLSETESKDTIVLDDSNTTMVSGLYTNDGAISEADNYSTLYYPVGNYQSFVLTNYMIGTLGGAFVDASKKWISSFSTQNSAADEPKVVPKGAAYIAITVKANDPYKSIYGIKVQTGYQLKNLHFPDLEANIWSGKKIVWLGTSVPYGSIATSSYADNARQILGFQLVNASVPGLAIHTNEDGSKLTYGSSTLSIDEYQTQGTTIDAQPLPYVPGSESGYNNYYRTWENVFTPANADADLYVFDVAPNNTNFKMDDWDAFDKNNWKYTDGSSFAEHRTTFAGAVLFLMDKMYECNPMARMCFVLGSAFNYPEAKPVFEAIREAWNIPILDIWGRVNTSPKSLLQVRSLNGTNNHPSNFGHTVLGKMIANQLLGVA